MLAHQCSARGYLVVLVALLLTLLLLTSHRLHAGSTAALSHLTEGWQKSSDDNRPGAQKSPAGTPNASPDNNAPQPTESDEAFCNNDLKFLRSKALDLTDDIIYTRRCIKPVFGNPDRDAVANVSDPLFSGTTTLNLKGDCSKLAAPPPCETVSLEVPIAYPRVQGQYTHLMFAVATSFKRLQDSLPVFGHWLTNSGAQLVAVVTDADDLRNSKSQLRTLQAEYRKLNINATLVPPKLKKGLPRLDTPADAKMGSPAPVEMLHFFLLRDMLELATPHTEWLGVLDDDTFFPALHTLSLALRQHDHTKPRWLGALADNWSSNKLWGFMAFGGAGAFVSLPLARQLNPHLEACVRETTVATGDGLMRDCVYKYSRTKLTLVDGLYQHDIGGDASGFFESGRRPLSIHHWKSWYHEPVDKMAKVVGVCGDCFLQRWRFGTDTVLSNGYSVVVYKDGLDAIDLDRMEGTFIDADDRFDFIYGPFRPKLDSEHKKSYRLAAVDGSTGPGGRFRQVYVHRAPKMEGEEEEEENKKRLDEVIELVWEL